MFISTSKNENKSLQGSSFMEKSHETDNSDIGISPGRTDEIKLP